MRKSRAFSLVELLVVIAIAAVLVSILLPALSQSRDVARTLACSANQRSMFYSFTAYANDYREYPTDFQKNTTDYSNTAGEAAGYMFSPTPTNYTFGTASYTSYNYNTPISELPAWYKTSMFDQTSTLAHVVAKGYISEPREFMCNSQFKGTWVGARGYNAFVYNGPAAYGGDIANNGEWNHLGLLGHHSTSAPPALDFGVRFNEDPLNIASTVWSRSKIAFMACQSLAIGSGANTYYYEPHGTNPGFNVGASGQFEATWFPALAAIAPYNRNVVFADGHGQHVVLGNRLISPD